MCKEPENINELDPKMQRDIDCFDRGYISGFDEGKLFVQQESFIEILILVKLLEKEISYQNSDQQIYIEEIFTTLKAQLKTQY